MPEIWPTFGLTRRRADETGELSTEILKEHMPQSASGSNNYGVYDGVGIVMNGKQVGVTTPDQTYFSTGNIIIRADLGYANRVTLYVISDAIDRIIGAEGTFGTDPAWYGESTAQGRSINVQWCEHTSRGLSVANGVSAFAGTAQDWFTPVYLGPVFYSVSTPNEPYSTSNVTTVTVGGNQYVPTKNSILRVRDNETDGLSRITVVGIEINGRLYGKNADGKTQEDLIQEAADNNDGVVGDGWWKDLQNTEQTPSLFNPFPVPAKTPFSFDFGWEELGSVWANDPQLTTWDPYVSARTDGNQIYNTARFRDELNIAAYIYAVRINRENLVNGVAGSWAAADNILYRQIIRDFASNDARWDNNWYSANAVPGETLFDVNDDWTRGFKDPAFATDPTSAFANRLVEAYAPGYNAYFDGYAQGVAQQARNSVPLQTGDATYNWIIDECHLIGYQDGTDFFNGTFGKPAPGGDD